MVRAGEIEHGARIAQSAETIWNWSSPAGQVRAKRRATLILQEAGIHDHSVVLELGCGTGLFTECFAATGAKIIGIDIAPPLLEQAQARGLGERITFRIDDAEQLSFADETFDAVVGSSILHHLDLDKALCEVHRVLKPGGRLVFAEPNMANPQIALQRSVPAIRRWAGESPEETAFFRWSLAKQLRETGFTNILVRPHEFLHPVVPGPLIPVVNGFGWLAEHVPLVREIAGSLLIRAVRAQESISETGDGNDKTLTVSPSLAPV